MGDLDKRGKEANKARALHVVVDRVDEEDLEKWEREVKEKVMCLGGEENAMIEKGRVPAKKEKALMEKEGLLVQEENALIERGRVLAKKEKALMEKEGLLMQEENLLRKAAAKKCRERGQVVVRNRARWGTGLDRLAADNHEIFPLGWILERSVGDSMKVFGHKSDDVAEIMEKGEQLQLELAPLGITTGAEQNAVLYAYTQEGSTDLCGKLNHACHLSECISKKRLPLYRDYLYHLQGALAMLVNFQGRFYCSTIAG